MSELSKEQAGKIVRNALSLHEAGDAEGVLSTIESLVGACAEQQLAATAVAFLLQQGAIGRQRGLELTELLLEHHSRAPDVVVGLGLASERFVDLDYLNAALGGEPVLVRLGEALRELVRTSTDPEVHPMLVHALGRTARVLGRAWDDVAEAAYLRAIELAPGDWQCEYDLGLFYKTRGRFREGQAANQRAFDSGGSEDDSVRWNLGICATGAGDAKVALRVWKLLGQKIELGRFGLPEGGYDMVKVRLAQRPLAERRASEDDPGTEETIWIERLSPCHGIVRSALFYDEIGVDFGDVVLFDGAAITSHEVNGKQVPVFPHLATLIHSQYRVFRFVGTQQHARQLGKLSAQLPGDAVIYSHTEQMRHMCRECWEKGTDGHSHLASDEQTVVEGKLCAPPSLTERELLVAIDVVIANVPGVRLLVPDLCEAAGETDRADFERRRAAKITL